MPIRTTQDLPSHVKSWLADRRLEEVECVISDIVGVSRGKAMPPRKFWDMEHMFLPTSVFFQTVSGSYAEVGDHIEGAWKEVDMTLTPDISTARAVPWADDVTMQVICDMSDREGKPVPYAPRNVLKRVLALYEKRGLTPIVAPEMEFYLTKPNHNPAEEIVPPIGRTGRRSTGRQAYSIAGVDEFGAIIDDIYEFAEAQGLEIESVMQEGGAGQLEINMLHGHPLELADQVFTMKRTIREAALRHNAYATFMAKPMASEPGSAMHIHQSILDSKTGENIFSRKTGKATAAFEHYIGGQQRHLQNAVVLLAPYVNSYRRLIPDGAAPTNLDWAEDNRTTGIRIPTSKPKSRRVETRVAGMDCNPYLAMAACLASGYLGLTGKIAPRAALTTDAYDMPHSLPRSVLESLELFEADADLQKILNPEFSTLYAMIKRDEAAEFLQVISPWEREHLMLNV